MSFPRNRELGSALSKLPYFGRGGWIPQTPSERHWFSHWTDFHKIWYLNIFLKSFEKIQVSLKSDKNNGYFKLIPIYVFDHMSLISSCNEKCLRLELYRKNTFYVHYFFPKKFEIMWEKRSRPREVTDYNKAHAHFTLGTLGCKHRFGICNTHAFTLQQRLHDHASGLRYTYEYIAFTVGFKIDTL
jgi:hypothetical protein